MKIHWNPKYTTIAIYACIVAAATVLCIFLGIHVGEILSWIGRIIGILNPLIIGFVIAYLVNPLMKVFEEKVFCRHDFGGFRKRFAAFFSKTAGKENRHKSSSKRKKTSVPEPAAKPMNQRLRRFLSVISAYLVYAVVIGVLISIVIPQVALSYQNFMSQTGQYSRTLERWINTLSVYIPAINVDKVMTYLTDLINNWYQILQNVIPYLSGFFGTLLSQLKNVLLGVVLSFYFLASKDRLIAQCRKIVYAVLPQKRSDGLIDFFRFVDHTFGGFIIGKLLDSLIIGVLTFIVLGICGMPYYQLVSVIVGVTNVIPFFGPFIGAIPSALIIFFVSPTKAFWFVIIIIIIQQLDGNLIGPAVMGQKVGLSSLGVIVAITVMGGLFGFAGMLLGVPLFALIYVWFTRILDRRIEKQKSGGNVGYDASLGFDGDDDVKTKGKREDSDMADMQQSDADAKGRDKR